MYFKFLFNLTHSTCTCNIWGGGRGYTLKRKRREGLITKCYIQKEGNLEGATRTCSKDRVGVGGGGGEGGCLMGGGGLSRGFCGSL